MFENIFNSGRNCHDGAPVDRGQSFQLSQLLLLKCNYYDHKQYMLPFKVHAGHREDRTH